MREFFVGSPKFLRARTSLSWRGVPLGCRADDSVPSMPLRPQFRDPHPPSPPLLKPVCQAGQAHVGRAERQRARVRSDKGWRRRHGDSYGRPKSKPPPAVFPPIPRAPPVVNGTRVQERLPDVSSVSVLESTAGEIEVQKKEEGSQVVFLFFDSRALAFYTFFLLSPRAPLPPPSRPLPASSTTAHCVAPLFPTHNRGESAVLVAWDPCTTLVDNVSREAGGGSFLPPSAGSTTP